MSRVMQGIRVLEVAQYTFVPAAGAILADWGAEVIKVEHPVRSDGQRGFSVLAGVAMPPERNTGVEHANRGKLSIGIDVATAEGRDLVYRLAKTADVFLTNLLPQQRQRMQLDVEHIRAANPDIIYARGTAHGDKGRERTVGGYDSTAFWSRGGIGYALTPEEIDGTLSLGIPAFGDTIGGMNLAGGIAAALFHRSQTGEASEVDVSLLSSAWWAAGSSIDILMEYDRLIRAPMPRSGSNSANPFQGNYRTADGGTINMNTMAPGPHIRSIFEHLGLPDAADDPRFRDAPSLFANGEAASALVAQAIAGKPFAYWCEHLRTMTGQWAPVQSFRELAQDEQALANDMVFEVEASDGGPPLRLVRGPVQFDHEPVRTTRAPQAAEHTEQVLLDLGLEWQEIEDLKAKSAIA